MESPDAAGDPVARPPYHAVVEGGDLDCGSGLLLIIRRAMAPLAPGQVLEVRSRERSVAEDLPAWCRMVGHEWVGAWPGDGQTTYYQVRKGAEVREPKTLSQDLDALKGFRWTVRWSARPSAPGTAFARNQSWPTGAPLDFGPETEAPTAVELLGSALAAELGAGFLREAGRRGLTVDAIEARVTVEVTALLSALDLAAEGDPVVGPIEATLYVASPDPADAIDAAAWAVERRAPILASLKRATPVHVRWELV
ncbi:MAG: OsmC family protein [Firmicutes bacterium]|nr:OsmC family protein [Alicyclobacillaceae bacterium]MCL6497369.1 OsmC family protein [Bacillota bacterium]